MKKQLGEPEITALKNLRDLDAKRAEKMQRSVITPRRTDSFEYKYRGMEVNKSWRMLRAVLLFSAAISLSVMLFLWFWATGGDFNLIDWVREVINGYVD